MDQQQLEVILNGLEQGDARCQSAFYRHCHGELMKVALRYHASADEAAASFNKAMLQVFQKIRDYRREGAVMGWVRRIIVNTCLNELRGRLRFSSVDFTDEGLNSFSAGPEVYAGIEARRLLDLVHALPDTTRTVFNLYVMEGYTHEQVAAALKIPKGTSKWHLHQARTQLKERLLQQAIHEAHILQK
ncbi:RNA polymerase sigma factor [Flaviaesturariibacter amylovorans]|uniref:RNA polymerase sigma factor n=1 Tax=Flaviaesturariibacter amylovorans TaxID=1084520 RepID=A0ABP8HET3_9BACT